MQQLLDNLPATFNLTTSLKDFIRRIKTSKTADEERSIITNECARIRNALKSDDKTSIHKNMTKLLYINLLGYPTQFGLVESTKLIGSQYFGDKRIGYLAFMIFLEDNFDFLILVTNSLEKDIQSSNQYS